MPAPYCDNVGKGIMFRTNSSLYYCLSTLVAVWYGASFALNYSRPNSSGLALSLHTLLWPGPAPSLFLVYGVAAVLGPFFCSPKFPMIEH